MMIENVYDYNKNDTKRESHPVIEPYMVIIIIVIGRWHSKYYFDIYFDYCPSKMDS